MRSVKNYLSGAKTFIISKGGSTHGFTSPLITTLLKGAANQSLHQEHQAPPLPRDLLFKLCDGLRALGDDGAVAAAACLFGVATFLRQSNFLLTPGADDRHLVTRADVELGVAGMPVHVRSTKTISPRSGGVVIPVARAPGGKYCPVRSCTDAWGLVTGAPNGVLFILPSSGTPLSAPRLGAMARRVLHRLGWPEASGFTPHSLRRTGARLARSAGVGELDLMLHGTWTSSAVQLYAPRPPVTSVPAAIASVLAADQTS